MSQTVKNSAEKQDFSSEFISPTDHGVNYEPIGSAEFFRLMRARRIRRWLITDTCRNCPGHFRLRRPVDSQLSLGKDMMRERCPVCLDDSLEFFMQDLGPAQDDEPCVDLNGEVWK